MFLSNLSVTSEASGEIRLALRVPVPLSPAHKRRAASQRPGAGCASLVYSELFREKGCQRAGFGQLPRNRNWTGYAKRILKNAVGALEKRFGKRCVFGTLTLAGSTSEAREALARFSSKLVELLNHWRLYHAPHSLWVYKWEWQRSGALHLHFALGSDSLEELRYLERNFQNYTYKLHEDVSKYAAVDMFQRQEGGSWKGFPEIIRSRIEPVRKSVKRYLAKYLSKPAVAAQGYCPARWSGLSRDLRALCAVYRRCTSIPSQNLELLVRLSKQAAALVKQRELTMYEYGTPFSPHSYTWLIYPPEDSCNEVYDSLAEILRNGEIETERLSRSNRQDGVVRLRTVGSHLDVCAGIFKAVRILKI